ncbi:hypothetical protein BCV50_20395 [Bacillus subtilis]|nr:hypothetical protein BCV50_20395 [Bacillus subtilis]
MILIDQDNFPKNTSPLDMTSFENKKWRTLYVSAIEIHNKKSEFTSFSGDIYFSHDAPNQKTGIR